MVDKGQGEHGSSRPPGTPWLNTTPASGGAHTILSSVLSQHSCMREKIVCPSRRTLPLATGAGRWTGPSTWTSPRQPGLLGMGFFIHYYPTSIINLIFLIVTLSVFFGR